MIVVVGSMNMDIVVQVDAHPQAGETLQGSDYVLHPGGKGANQAVAAARAGAGNARFIGKAGIDQMSDTLLDSMAASGVDIHAVQRVARPVGVAFINVTPDGQNSITVSPGANSGLLPQDLDIKQFEGAAVVLTQLEIPYQTALRALEIGREVGALTMLNLSPARLLSHSQLAMADLLVLNEPEARFLLPEAPSDYRELAVALGRLVPRVVVTLGSRGVAWADGQDSGLVPAIRVRTVDSTGAGDAFAGALAVALAEGQALPDAIRFATAAGALSVQVEGAQASMPEREAIEELLEQTPAD